LEFGKMQGVEKLVRCGYHRSNKF